MKYSNLFGKTIKTVPGNYKTPSHRFLYQGGFVRQVSAGRYAYLPLGFRVWQKIMNIVDEEMEAVGSQRLNTPILQPIEIWKVTNRDAAFGDEMHIVDDHHGATFAMGATAEGVMIELVKMFAPSYRELPFYVHQFTNKFRDEKRPRGGILRVREFTMKDAYSFDRSEEASYDSYQKFYDSYLKIAQRLDLKAYPVLAESGAIGGDYNHEFVVLSESGETEALTCAGCGYASQVERAEGGYDTHPQDKDAKEVKEFWDDTVVNCEILAERMGVPIYTTTKTIMFKADGKFVAAMVRGDYDINETKLKRHLGAESLELATEKEISDLTGAKVGFVGPVGLPDSVLIVADITCQDRTNFEAGGNKSGLHLYNLNYERDFKTPEFVDIREVKEDDACVKCGKGKLKKIKGIEWGHCFKLDTFYSEPHKGNFTDSDGSDKPIWMGSYGIGLGRSMATVVETHHDENGIIWPESVAPFKVHFVGVNLEDKTTHKKAHDLYEKLVKNKIEVLFDDRETVMAGEKFADADLIGCPYRIVVSKKTGDKVEIKKRNEKASKIVTVKELLSLLGA